MHHPSIRTAIRIDGPLFKRVVAGAPQSKSGYPQDATFATDDFVEAKPGAALIELTRQQETELPAVAKLSYYAAESGYRQAIAEARRTTTGSLRIATAELPVVMEATQAALMADTWLYESWNARERASFTLPPSALALEPSDLLRIEYGGRERLMRVTEIGDGGRREITALGIDPAVYDRLPAPARDTQVPRRRSTASPRSPFSTSPSCAATRSRTKAMSPLSSRLGRVAPRSIDRLIPPAIRSRLWRREAPSWGARFRRSAPHASGRWDRANALVVRLLSGELSSATELSLLEGSNLAALSRPDGSWEVLQFQTAELIAPNTYRLTQLLRGQGGSDVSNESMLPTDATFILLNGAITPAGLSLADLHRTFNWRYGPANKDIGSASFATRAVTYRGVGLRPLSPVHVRAARNASGDIALSWIRRTRIGGDNWELADVPLGEDSERYELDILDPANASIVVRTLTVSIPSAAYTQAQQIADFGAAQSVCHVRVHQISALLGRGAAAGHRLSVGSRLDQQPPMSSRALFPGPFLIEFGRPRPLRPGSREPVPR